MRQISLLLVCLVCLVPGLSTAPSGGCGGPLPPQPRPGHHSSVTVSLTEPGLGEVRRDYSLHLPAQYDTSNTQALPLVLDYHGWTGSASQQMSGFYWSQVAYEDEAGFIYVAMDGMSDVVGGGNYGSWNVSRTEGPLGLTCDPPLHGSYPCFSSCGGGDCSYLEDSCDWTSCHDDLVFTQAVLYQVLSSYCINTESIHFSGWSNGAMFIYSRALASLSASLASVAPVAGSPLRGFSPRPDSPVNIIDFHGYLDETVPYSADAPGNLGQGPDSTVISAAGYYFLEKPAHIKDLVSSMNCDPESSDYKTEMEGWGCVVWAGCDGDKEVVHCSGYYGHFYPWWGAVEGFNIIWQFMKNHPRSSDDKEK